MLRAEGPPLTPSGSQARELLRQELAKPEYQERKGPVQRLVEWISDTLNDFFSTQGGTLPSIAWLVGLLLVTGLWDALMGVFRQWASAWGLVI